MVRTRSGGVKRKRAANVSRPSSRRAVGSESSTVAASDPPLPSISFSTRPKGHVKLEVEEAVPTKTQFRRMARFAKTQIVGAEGTPTEYAIGDEVYVVPPDATVDRHGDFDAHYLWRARIEQIRCEDPENPVQVWVEISWYWAPTEFVQLKKTFNPRLCGSKEIIYVPDKQKIVSCASLNGHTTVFRYDDSDVLRTEQIAEGEYYCRTLFDKGVFVTKPHISCVCKKQYIPDDDEVMILCPRSSCRHWYHTTCLRKRNLFTSPCSAYALELAWQSTQDDSSSDIFESELAAICTPSPSSEAKPEIEDHLHQLSDLACRPCMRGAGYSTVGNAGVVLRARYLVALVQKGVSLPASWKAFVWGVGGLWDMPTFEYMEEEEGGEMDNVTSFVCPSCEKLI